MATRLTPFSRLLIVVLILAAIIFGGRYLINKGTFGDIMNSDKKEATDGTDTKITQGKALHSVMLLPVYTLTTVLSQMKTRVSLKITA